MAAKFKGMSSSFVVPPDPQVSFKGKNILITGGNTGIGLAAAVKFLNLSASKVIITTRNMDKGEAAKEQIRSQATRKDGCVDVWQLDMESYESIRLFAKKASTDLDHLDVVILSAGVAPRYFTKAVTGWELALQVNVLSTTLLGLLLLPKLRSSKTPNSIPILEIVAARIHESVKLTEAERASSNILSLFNAQTAETYQGWRQYSLSKLFLIYAVKGLAAKAISNGEPDVIVVSVCPGACKSDLQRDFDGGIATRMVKSIVGAVLLKTAEEGARTYVIGTTKGVEAHGRFMQNTDIRE